jgi:sec-independent protein translocase protein TatA
VFGLSPVELMVVGVVAILLFGSKLPDVARSLGQQYRELRRGMNDIQEQFRQAEREVKKAIDAPIKSFNDALTVSRDTAASEEELIKEPSVPKFTPPPSESPNV